MTAKKKYPVRGTRYTLEEILMALELRDSPFLCFRHKGEDCVVQLSHCTDENIFSSPDLTKSVWTYRYETEEWIPIFNFATDNPKTPEELFNIEPDVNGRDGYYVTPKGFPREQYKSKY